MKKSKLLSLIMALVMLMAFALPMTAGAAGTAKITIRPPASLVLTASDFTAYRLFDVTVSQSGTAPDIVKNYAYTPIQPAVNNFLAYLVTKYAGAVPYGTNPAGFANADAFKAWLETVSDNATILTALTKDIKDSGAFTAINTATKAGNDVVFSGLEFGYYLVAGKGVAEYEAGTTDDVDVIAHSALVTVDSIDTEATIDLKADAPKVEKEVWNHTISGATTPANPTDPGWKTWTDVSVGDTVSFRYLTKVPNMKGYTSYSYKFYDTLSDGFTLANNFAAAGVTVTIGGASFTDFTTVVAGDGKSFTVTFGSTFISKTAGTDIIVTYAAILDEDAVVGAPGNPNKVYLEYSNDPYSSGKGRTPEDEVKVYTFDMEIYKYTGDLLTDKDTPLGGAEFELRKSGGSAVVVTKLTGDPDGYQYRVSTPAEITADAALPAGSKLTTTTLVSDANGIIKIKGLDAGSYELEETKAPSGYNLLAGFKSVVIIHEDQAGGYSMTVDASPSNTVNIENNAGGKLPSTGGIGTTIFYIAGSLLLIGAVVALIVMRKRSILNGK